MVAASMSVGFTDIFFLSAGSVAQVQTGGVAYLAHIGGFLFGVVTARIFEGFRPIVESET